MNWKYQAFLPVLEGLATLALIGVVFLYKHCRTTYTLGKRTYAGWLITLIITVIWLIVLSEFFIREFNNFFSLAVFALGFIGFPLAFVSIFFISTIHYPVAALILLLAPALSLFFLVTKKDWDKLFVFYVFKTLVLPVILLVIAVLGYQTYHKEKIEREAEKQKKEFTQNHDSYEKGALIRHQLEAFYNEGNNRFPASEHFCLHKSYQQQAVHLRSTCQWSKLQALYSSNCG
jgi:hypothetical protein